MSLHCPDGELATFETDTTCDRCGAPVWKHRSKTETETTLERVEVLLREVRDLMRGEKP